MVGLIRLGLVSDKFLHMIGKIMEFLIDKYERGDTMFRGCGVFHNEVPFAKLY